MATPQHLHAVPSRVARFDIAWLQQARLLTLSAIVMVVVLAGCASTTTSQGLPPPSLPAPRLLAIADGGRATLSQIIQLGADPGAGKVYILAGHQIVGPVVSAPWADHLIAVDRSTGTPVWGYGTPSTGYADQAHRLSAIVVDYNARRVLLATSQRALALNAADGGVAVAVPLPSGIDCVSFPAPTQQPTVDVQGRALFACAQGGPEPRPVGALVDFTQRTVTIVPPPPSQGVPTFGKGVLGHVYSLADDGLRVFAQEPSAGSQPIEALPFALAGLGRGLVVETSADGTPTGRLYLAGIGAQVAILQDSAPDTLRGQSGSLWATVLAERAVALAVDPQRYHDTQTLPVLPNFLVAPGQLARTFCFGPSQPLAPNTVTTTTAATQSADGSVQVDLRISVRDAQGSESGFRHWTVSVAQGGGATIRTDEGSVNPFMPVRPVPCPV